MYSYVKNYFIYFFHGPIRVFFQLFFNCPVFTYFSSASRTARKKGIADFSPGRFSEQIFFPRGRQTIKELQSETLFHVDVLTIFYPRLFEVMRSSVFRLLFDFQRLVLNVLWRVCFRTVL